MEALDINGVKVLFPYKPYDIQLDYMKTIVKCLQEVWHQKGLKVLLFELIVWLNDRKVMDFWRARRERERHYVFFAQPLDGLKAN